MKRVASVAGVVCITAVLFVPPCAAQGCKHWAEALARSFFPRQVNEQGLRTFSALSPQEYFQALHKLRKRVWPSSPKAFPSSKSLSFPTRRKFGCGLLWKGSTRLAQNSTALI